MAAGGAIIGALRVVIGADTAALETGLKSAQSSLKGFASGLNTSMAAVGVAVAGAAVAIGVAIKSTINEADKIGKMSQSIGVPVDELSKLKYAADLSDVSLEQLGVSMGKLAKSMSATAGGAVGPAGEAFKALSINVKNSDGTLKSSSTVLTEIAEKFAGYEDSAAKTALAIALFGKAGAAMIPLLNQGKVGLQEAKTEAEQLGIVLDSKTAKGAELFNDNLKRMGAVFSGIIVQVTSLMLPAFTQMSTVLVDTAKNSDLMKTAADGLVFVIRGAVTAAVTAAVVFQRLGAELNALWATISAPNWEAMKSAWAAFQAVGQETDQKFKALGETMTKFWQDAGASAEKGGQEIAKGTAPIIEATNKAKSAIQSFLDSTLKKTAAMEAEAQTIGKSVFETERLKIVLEGLAIAKANNIPVTEKLRQQIDAIALSYAAMTEKAQFGKQLFEQTRTPVEQFGIAIERLNSAMQRGAIDADTYARGVAQAQDQLVRANPAAQVLGQSLETAFGRAMEKGAQFGDVLRSLLQDLVKASASAAFRALLYGNAAQGGTSAGFMGALFSGAPKFAGGGSFTVGGSGGTDSQLTTMWTTPGERVTVDKRGGGGQTTNNFIIENHGADVQKTERKNSSGGIDFVAIVRSVNDQDFSDGRYKHLGVGPNPRMR